jgi:hypothetical protein
MKTPRHGLAAALLLLGAAGASAADLTGSWTGKLSCTLLEGQGKRKHAAASTLEVSHPDGPGTPRLDLRVDGQLRPGFVLGAGGALRGGGAITDCTQAPSPAGSGEIRNFRFKVAAEGVAGSIAWRGLLVEDDALIGVCRGRWRRVSTADPALPSCR